MRRRLMGLAGLAVMATLALAGCEQQKPAPPPPVPDTAASGTDVVDRAPDLPGTAASSQSAEPAPAGAVSAEPGVGLPKFGPAAGGTALVGVWRVPDNQGTLALLPDGTVVVSSEPPGRWTASGNDRLSIVVEGTTLPARISGDRLILTSPDDPSDQITLSRVTRADSRSMVGLWTDPGFGGAILLTPNGLVLFTEEDTARWSEKSDGSAEILIDGEAIVIRPTASGAELVDPDDPSNRIALSRMSN